MFNSILLSNSKLTNIKSITYETGLTCSSNKKGFCNICKYCYALRDNKRFKHTYENQKQASENLNKVLNDPELTKLFIEYLKIENIKIIRFNLAGDFTTKENIYQLINLAKSTPNIKYYGYTKRVDLLDDIKELIKLDNIFLNSNIKAIYKLDKVNEYKSTFDIKEFLENNYKCSGDCSNCGHCYTLRNQKITVLVHGSPSLIQKKINTIENKKIIFDYINENLGLNIDYKEHKGFFIKGILDLLHLNNIDTPKTKKNKEVIKSTVDLIKFIKLFKLNTSLNKLL